MPIIQANHLTKDYRLGALQGRKQTLSSSAVRITGKKVEPPTQFKGLDEVIYTIEPGKVVCIGWNE